VTELDPFETQRAADRGMGNPTQCQDYAVATRLFAEQVIELSPKVITTVGNLTDRRTIPRRQTFHRSGDPGVDQFTAVSGIGARESGLIQASKQKIAAGITTERPPGPVRAVHPGCKSDNQQTSPPAAPGGHRGGMIVRILCGRAQPRGEKSWATAAVMEIAQSM
jgi:hypothetical protein